MGADRSPFADESIAKLPVLAAFKGAVGVDGPRAFVVGEDAMGTAEDAVLKGHTVIDGDPILDLDIVPDLDTGIDVDAFTENTVLANAGIFPDLAVLPYFGPLPYLGFGGYV
jgi:hypothetical protein